MKKIIITVVAYLIATAATMAQDRIITKNGDVMEAYRIDVGSTFVYYAKTDNDDAAIQKISKDDVLMIKKHDNTVINLYEATAPTRTAMEEPAAEAPAQGNTQVKPEDLSAEGEAANNALISRLNRQVCITLNKKREKKRGKPTDHAHAIWGVKEGSIMADEYIEISAERGTMYKESKSTPAVFRTDAWLAPNPAIRFNVKNKTGKTLYLDLGHSFFVRLGQAQCYYVPSSTTTSASSSSGSGLNIGAVTDALGIGGVVGTLSDGVTVGGGSTKETTSTTYSQRVIAVPPQSSVALAPQYVFGNENRELSKGCSYATWLNSYDFYVRMNFSPETPDGKMMVGDHYKYEEGTSPLQWSFVVAYSTTEDCAQQKSLASYFYLKDLCGAGKSEIDYDGEFFYCVDITGKKGLPFPKN